MSYVRKIYTGEEARRLARFGNLSGKRIEFIQWWPEKVCQKIEKIVWTVYSLGELGDDWHEFKAYDKRGNVLGVHHVEGY